MMNNPENTERHVIEEAVLKALYDALKADQIAPQEPASGVAVGMLDLRHSAIYLATEANWRKWVRA